MDKTAIKAARLLSISEQLQAINDELKTLINAPEKPKKLSKTEKQYLKFQRK